VWFKDAKQERLYRALCDKAQVQAGEREYLASLYVLAALDKPVERFVLPREIDFPALVKQARPWSSGEKALVKLAATLFNSTFWKVSLHDVFCRLDSTNFLSVKYRLAYLGRNNLDVFNVSNTKSVFFSKGGK
jgi:hypothetical protein